MAIYAERLLREQFGVAELTGFGLDGHSQAVAAAGAIVHYLRENAARRGEPARLGEPPGGSTNGDATSSLEALRHLDCVRYSHHHTSLVLHPAPFRTPHLIPPTCTGESS